MPLPLTDRRRAAARAIALATAIAVPVLAARRVDTLPDGLRGQYFSNRDWSGEPARSTVDPVPSTGVLLAVHGGDPPAAFSASWSGWIIAPRDDAYTFASTSDDGSWIYVDGALAVDNGGAHAPATKTGSTIRLTRGPHALFVRYFQSGGGVELSILWQRGAAPFEPVPSWALRPRRIEYARFAVDRALEIAGTIAAWAWWPALAGALLFGFWPEAVMVDARRRATLLTLRREGVWPALAWILAASAALNLVGLWWGLPHGYWVGDELLPSMVATGWEQSFSHGWFDKYPPLHYYILALAYLPVLGAEALFGVPPAAVETVLMAIGRVVSVVMAAATVLATFFIGRRVFGARSGLFAAAMLALSAPFIYYAKAANVDVPYVCWFAVSLICYLRVIDGGTRADFVWWGVTAALAVCTKDQAYGLYVAMPIPVIVELWRRKAPIVPPLVTAAIAAFLTFAAVHNVLFNLPGFLLHTSTITGHASWGYRVFEPTLSGRLALLALTLRLVPLSWGWPMSIVCLVGVALGLGAPERRRTAAWLLVPVVSYQLAFVDVVLYNYDRFLLPAFVVLAAFGGYALDRFTWRADRTSWQHAVVAVVFAYTLLYGGTVDALMLTDSRYDAERWLRAHVETADAVATTSIATYMPRTADFDSVDVPDPEALDTLRPRFVVVNRDYAFIEPSDTPLGRVLATLRSGHGGYRLAFSARTPSPWPWLPGAHPDLAGDRLDPAIVSFLRNINPTIDIFERRPYR